MELVMAVAIGILVAAAIYLLLSKRLLRIVLGTVLFSHAAHLFMITSARLKRGEPPYLGENPQAVADALPQALVLTAIVIGFGVTAFLLVLAYRAYQELGTDDLDKLRGVEDEF